MGNKNLQQLAKEYAVQEIDKASYREKRSQLLDSITGQTASDSVEDSLQNSLEESEINKTEKNPDRRKKLSKLAVTLVQVALLIALVLGFFYFF